MATSRPNFRVVGLIDFAHAACADGGQDVVRAEAGSGRERHRLVWTERIIPQSFELLRGHEALQFLEPILHKDQI